MQIFIGSIGTCASCCMHMYDRDAAFTRARVRAHAHARGTRRAATSATVCIGESCEYMHKNVCFCVPAPSSGHPPSGPLAPTSSRASLRLPRPSAALVRTPMQHVDDGDVAACMHSVKMSSDLERASRMLTFPARRGMITSTTYIGMRARYCNRVSEPLF